jgi:hypothetical protein
MPASLAFRASRNPLHQKLIALMSRPNGATINGISEAGWMYSAIAALQIAERRGFKTNVVKKSGELARYVGDVQQKPGRHTLARVFPG